MELNHSQDIDTANESWAAIRDEATNCPSFDVQSLIDRALACWGSKIIEYKALAYAHLDRAKNASLARSLREAEQAIRSVALSAFRSIEQGHNPGRINELAGALGYCRMLIVLPAAKRMAEVDGMDRSAEAIAFALAAEAQFVDGRAVISQAVASKFPSPYKAEAANT